MKTLEDILLADCERTFLTRKGRQVIRSAAAELARLRIIAKVCEDAPLAYFRAGYDAAREREGHYDLPDTVEALFKRFEETRR